MKIVMVAGGTGGHIYPAISLAKELQKRGHEIYFIGANDRMEKTAVPEAGFKFIGLDIKSTSGGFKQKLCSLKSMISAYHKCLKILKNNADLVIGFGNYISLPVLKAATHLGIKTMLHEQNSYAGKANLALEKDAELVVASYEESLKQFKTKKIEVLGNPQSSIASKAVRNPEVIKEFGLDPNKKTVVIFMGSLGSKTVSKIVGEYIENLDHKNYQLIYATGRNYYATYKDIKKENVVIRERIDGLNVMRNADLVVSRAGATTLAEITALGIASILVPSPYVANNHQYYNAMALVNKDAAVLLEEKDLTAVSLNDKIEELINDDAHRENLAKNAKSLCNENVIEDMIDRIEKIWKQ